MPNFGDGIVMKYPSRTAGESYILPLDIEDRQGVENRWDGGRILLTGQPAEFQTVDTTTVELDNNEDVRLYVTTSDGYGATGITTDRRQMLKNRFMQTTKDWHNVEITFQFVYTGGNDGGAVTLGCRGGLQEVPCEGFAYKAMLNFTGTSGTFSKQQYYPSGNKFSTFTTTKLGSSIKNKTVAMKFIVYDVDSNLMPTLSKTAAVRVVAELYASVDGGAMRKLSTRVDSGEWNNIAVCGGDGDEIGLWGGPLVFAQWNNGAEIDIKSFSVREIDPTKDFQTPSGGDTISGNPTPPPPPNSTTNNESANDDYGVKKIYQTDPNGTHFYPPVKGMTSDDRFDANGADIKNKGDGTYSVTGKSRMLMYVSKLANQRGEDYVFPTYDFDELQKRGFWDSSKDYKNIEVTVYLTCKTLTGSADELSLVVRSVRHEESDHGGCGGSSYHGSLRFTDGAARFNKEMRHVDYAGYLTSDKKLGKIIGKKTGLKFICYNASSTSVQLELWLDRDADNHWVKYNEFLDVGKWGDGMKTCGALTSGAAITWGSTKLVFKDNGLDMTLSKFSIRSITKHLMSELPDTGGGGGGTGDVSRVFAKYICLYDIIVDSDSVSCQGGGTGGSPPPSSPTYNEITDLTVTDITNPKQMSGNFSSEDDRKRVGWMVNSDSAKLKGKKITRVKVYLRRHGSPTGDLTVVCRDGNNNQITTWGNPLNVATLNTSYDLTTFTNDDAPDDMPSGMQKNWKIQAEYSGGDSSNYVEIGVNYDAPVDSDKTILVQYEKENGTDYSVVKHTDRDMCGFLYTS